MNSYILKHKKLVFLLFIALFFMQCKSSKSIINSGVASSKLSAKQVIKQHNKNKTSFNTLQARLKVDIKQDKKEQGFSFNLRMKKDEVIWLKASLGLARLKLTPSSVKFYNKLGKEYFDGNYDLLSQFVGVELDFNKVQNILLGEAIFNFGTTKKELQVVNNNYEINSGLKKTVLKLLYVVNPSHFKLQTFKLNEFNTNRTLAVNYNSYQDVSGKIMPQLIKILAEELNEQIDVAIEYKNITLDEEIRFPFKFPKGYKEIKL